MYGCGTGKSIPETWGHLSCLARLCYKTKKTKQTKQPNFNLLFMFFFDDFSTLFYFILSILFLDANFIPVILKYLETRQIR